MKVIVRKDLTFGSATVRKGGSIDLPNSQAKELIEVGLAFADLVGEEPKKRITKEEKRAYNRKVK